ncbi:MAG: glycoside hydrolase family 3 protein, partial [candidate division KSB1 bacterium]
MKTFLKIIGVLLLAVLVIVLAGLGWFYFSRTGAEKSAMAKAAPPPPTLRAENFSFRDLNQNGRLDLYEDARQPTSVRVEDLLGQMTL